jgi:hypothetical protein
MVVFGCFIHIPRGMGHAGGNWWDLRNGFIIQVQESEIEVFI